MTCPNGHEPPCGCREGAFTRWSHGPLQRIEVVPASSSGLSGLSDAELLALIDDPHDGEFPWSGMKDYYECFDRARNKLRSELQHRRSQAEPLVGEADNPESVALPQPRQEAE